MSCDGEIAGLKASSNVRSCESHESFVENLSADDIIQFRFCVLDFENGPEEAVNTVVIKTEQTCVLLDSFPEMLQKVGR